MTEPYKLTVLISGNGSNLQALIDACGTDALPNTEVKLVISKYYSNSPTSNFRPNTFTAAKQHTVSNAPNGRVYPLNITTSSHTKSNTQRMSPLPAPRTILISQR